MGVVLNLQGKKHVAPQFHLHVLNMRGRYKISVYNTTNH